jgi:hypothetical protein
MVQVAPKTRGHAIMSRDSPVWSGAGGLTVSRVLARSDSAISAAFVVQHDFGSSERGAFSLYRSLCRRKPLMAAGCIAPQRRARLERFAQPRSEHIINTTAPASDARSFAAKATRGGAARAPGGLRAMRPFGVHVGSGDAAPPLHLPIPQASRRAARKCDSSQAVQSNVQACSVCAAGAPAFTSMWVRTSTRRLCFGEKQNPVVSLR